jgi:hypothetical protein
MELNFYCIGGKLNAPDDFVGTAHDLRTAISLTHLLRLSECSAAKLQGTMPGVTLAEPTEFSITHLIILLTAACLGDADTVLNTLQGKDEPEPAAA